MVLPSSFTSSLYDLNLSVAVVSAIALVPGWVILILMPAATGFPSRRDVAENLAGEGSGRER